MWCGWKMRMGGRSKTPTPTPTATPTATLTAPALAVASGARSPFAVSARSAFVGARAAKYSATTTPAEASNATPAISA